jgi:hypothetical protein
MFVSKLPFLIPVATGRLSQTPPAGVGSGIFDYGALMREIVLVNGNKAFIDDEDYEKTTGYKWYLLKYGNNQYAIGYKYDGGNQTACLLHRLIMPVNEKDVIDHIDFNGLNNCKSNLRVVSNYENSWHHRLSKNNTSGYRGVSWDKSKGKYRATLRRYGEYFHLGNFSDAVEAARAYDEAAEKMFGVFAVKNFKEAM